MPVVAGVLLSLALVIWLAGFHAGPHAHFVAAAIALAGAGWLVIAILDGRSAPAMWAVVAAAVLISSVAVLSAVLAVSGRGTVDYDPHRIEGREAIVIDDLAPDGRVRVRGEVWAATSVNGVARAGTRTQVLRATGLRLEVWAEEPDLSADPM
jgi:membrane protein implicated in regulation of membrane protease activity